MYPLLDKESKKAEEYDRKVSLADLLVTEKAQLEQFKKSLPDNLKAILKELSHDIKGQALRDDNPLTNAQIEVTPNGTSLR